MFARATPPHRATILPVTFRLRSRVHLLCLSIAPRLRLLAEPVFGEQATHATLASYDHSCTHNRSVWRFPG